MNELKMTKEENNRISNREVVGRLNETMSVKPLVSSYGKHFLKVAGNDRKYQDGVRDLEMNPEAWSLRLWIGFWTDISVCVCMYIYIYIYITI